jgi:tRNA dimethylallyltransferase
MVTPPLLVLVGPTGVGKTAVAVRLAALLPIEAVSADSRQIYRGMDIGTGKPTAHEQAVLTHHLIDVADPGERYHAARFRADALAALDGIRGRGRLAVVVGGTGLYVRALLKGLRPAPPADPALREELDAFAGARGARALHDRLATLDPVAAGRLHPNDRVRIVRAIEVRLGVATGVRTAEGEWTDGATSWRLLMVGLRQSRERLRARLADRARDMLARGMLEEVERLRAAGHGDSSPAMEGIGYRQCGAVLRGELAIDEALRLMIRDTVRYAKRQMTWFARDPEIRWIDMDAAGGPDAAALAIARQAVQEGLIE